MIRKLALHVSNYSVASLLVMISGFISFPIFTRIFSIEEYGVLNLISGTLALVTGIAKLGIQHSIVRFYGEIKSGRSAVNLLNYRSTTFFGMIMMSTIVTMIWVIVSQMIPSSWWSDRNITGLLLFTSVLVIVRVVDSCLSNFLRAEERSGLLSVYRIASRYLGLAMVLFTLFYVACDLRSFYGATIVIETSSVVFLFMFLRHGFSFTPFEFSSTLFKRMLVFGIPMIGFELAGIILNIGDRYVIQALLGSAPLGIYSVGYNFCEYVQIIVFSSIGQAIMPMYVRSWEENGEEPTRHFLHQSLHFYSMVALPVVAGLSAVGGDLLVFLASKKYMESATIIPLIIGGMAIDGIVIIVGAGLFIRKQTFMIAGLVGSCALFNIVLNVVLVPQWGIIGSAFATLISYLALALTMLRVSSKTMPISFPWTSVIKFSGLSVIMYVTIIQLSFGNAVLTVICKIGIGTLLYSAMVAAFDKQARAAIRKGFVWYRSQRTIDSSRKTEI